MNTFENIYFISHVHLNFTLYLQAYNLQSNSDILAYKDASLTLRLLIHIVSNCISSTKISSF